MDFLQLAGNYVSNRASNRANQAIEPFADPAAYLDQRMDANVAPVQTTQINPAEAASQDFVPGGELVIERPGMPISQYLAQARRMSVPAQKPVQPEPELPPNAFPDPNAQMSRPQGVSAPGSASEAAAMSAAPTIYERFRDNQNDLKSVSAVAFDDAAPGAVRYAANDKLLTAMNNQNQIKKTTAEVDAALSDPSGKGAMKMLNAIAREREDGSLLKAIFYQRMGLNDLAKAEQLKLGAADNYQPVALPDGRQGYVKVNYQGAPIAGWTDAGEMTPDELINAQIGTKGSDVGKQAYKNRDTGELYFLRTTQNGRAQMVNTKGQVYTGDTSRLYAYGMGSDIETKNTIQRQELQNKLAYAPATKRAEIVAEWEAKNGPMSTDARNRALSGQPLPDIIGAVPVAGEQVAPRPAVAAPASEAPTVQAAPVVEAPPAPAPVAPAPVVPKGKAKAGTNLQVSPEVQRARDTDRLGILNQELATNQQALAAATNPTDRQRIQSNIDAIKREIGGTQKNLGVVPAAEAPTGGTTYRPGVFQKPPMQQGESIGAYEARVKAAQDAFNAQEERNKKIFEENLKREQSIREKKETLPIEQEKEERAAFVKLGTEISDDGARGSTIKNIRQQQIQILRDQPQIAGILYGKGTQYDNARRFIIDSLSGKFSGTEGGAARAEAIGNLGLNVNEKAALQTWANLTASINQQTLKLTAGAGSVSEAEQRANKEANMQYVERLEPYMVVSELFRSQLEGDLKLAKREFLNRGQFNTRKEFENAWGQEQAKIAQQYKGISAARLAYLKPYFEAVDKAPNDKARDKALEQRRNAIMYSMTAFPPPEYNMQTGKWDYKTANSRKAAMSSVLGR